MTETNFIINCPINEHDINRALKIFEPPEPLVKGTMVTPTPITHKTMKIPLPISILQNNKWIRTYIDLCFVNNLPFFITRTEAVEYISQHPMPNKKKNTILGFLLQVLNIYMSIEVSLSTYLEITNSIMTRYMTGSALLIWTFVRPPSTSQR